MWSGGTLISCVMEGKLILVAPRPRRREDKLSPRPPAHPPTSLNFSQLSSPEVISSSRNDVDGALQLLHLGKDGVMVDDDGLNELIDVGLAGDLVVALWDRHQGGAETDGQVVWVHHVVVAVLGQAVQEAKQRHSETASIYNIHKADYAHKQPGLVIYRRHRPLPVNKLCMHIATCRTA